MTAPVHAERWRRINELFHAALERPAAERAAFLEASCAGEAELRLEVESLLAAHADAGDFIEAPAYELGAELLYGEEVERSDPTSGPLTGRTMGPYRIGRRIGSGGMGIVYLAEDTRLRRRVAFKALADHLVRDSRSRERLRREARAAAALSHPGIATVFALEELEGHLYIVYEYAEGRTLRDELGDGALPLDVAVGTGAAIARALEAAHRQGIVHRDLKPENVIRLRDGGIKILDFGLASFQPSPLMGPSVAGGPHSDVAAAAGARLTLPGMLLGTPAYMAPEQLRGLEVDFRADLFSFGVLLYEMASGNHPFAGDDPASTIARILEVEPPDLASAAGIESPRLASILESCLQKEPARRYRSTTELVEAIAGLEEAIEVGDDRDEKARRAGQAQLPRRRGALTDRQAALSSSPRKDAFWWWRFHQIAMGLAYWPLLYGLWRGKAAAAPGWAATVATALFLFGALLAIVVSMLRLHLAFTTRYYPEQLDFQRERAAAWIHGGESVYGVVIAAAALLVVANHPGFATILAGAAAALFVFGIMIEPTTTRAAFPGGGETPADRSKRS